MRPFALLLFFFAGSLPLAAGRIDITNDPSAWVHPGAELEVHFGTGSFHSNPSQIGVEIVAQWEPWFAAAALPSSTGTYFDGLLLEGWLVSRDGAVSVPLYDPNAAMLGLPLGSLLVMPGTFQAGGGSPLDVAVIAASVQLDEATAAALFGGNLGSYNDAAFFRFRNVGQGFTVELGPGYSVRNAISEQVGDGERTVSGVTGHVILENPEPATYALFGGALLVLGLLRRRAANPSRT